MANWQQIQARIRKAKTGGDPAAQLSELYQRTRDAMVAFELGAFQEKAADNVEAVRWYTVAAERFRRSQWRTKAEEALVRLGAPVPAPADKSAADAPASESAPAETEAEPQERKEQPEEDTQTEEKLFAQSSPQAESSPAAEAAPQAQDGRAGGRRRRRRGRRGGRRHHRAPGAAASAADSSGTSAATEPSRTRPAVSQPSREAMAAPSEVEEQAPAAEEASRAHVSHQPAVGSGWMAHARTGEPALASRLAQLESQLRRLLACPQALLEDAEYAPAGPGVLLLSDSDQQTHYYVEACQTLRIGIGNLLRGGRGSKDSGRLKSSMSDRLGIPEARVSKYLKDHCVVRWLQLDEGASELAHFAIAVLKPEVNE